MAYEQFVPLPNLNFQINRVLSNGPEGCREDELWEIAPHLVRFNGDVWYQQWHKLAQRADSCMPPIITACPNSFCRTSI